MAMGLRNLKQFVDAADVDGKVVYTSLRKVPAIAATAGNWVDLSMAPGNPKPNYYTGTELKATAFDGRTGIWHGGAVAPQTKYLHRLALLSTGTVSPATFLLCDYLLFYSLVDMDSTGEQALDNAVTLPRYTDGRGVLPFLVATNPYVGGASFWLSYTNQNGVAGRQTPPHLTNTSTYIATLPHTGPVAGLGGPFMRLAPGDTGVRSVQSITFSGPNGGLAALVLARPLATAMTRETTAWAEFEYFRDKAQFPVVQDGAYLNLLACPTGTVAAVPILGEAAFVWG
jgi:hypothetical protein